MTSTDYAVFWLNQTAAALIRDPADSLHHWTHPNYGGGMTGWESAMDRIYFKPGPGEKEHTYEEHLLHLEVRRVMLIALKNSIEKAERTTEEAEKWSIGNAMELVEALRVADMVAKVDPTIAFPAKRKLHDIARRMGESFTTLQKRSAALLMGDTGFAW